MARVACTYCGKRHEIGHAVPVEAKQATLVCDCGEQMEMRPGRIFGWERPRVETRDAV